LILDALRNGTGNASDIANNLSEYIQLTTYPNISKPKNPLSITEIDEYIHKLTNATLHISTTSSFIMVQPIDKDSNATVLGASFTRNIGNISGGIVNEENEGTVIKSNLSAAGIIREESLTDVAFLSVFIIDKNTLYENADNSTENKTLASSVIVAAVQPRSQSNKTNISLYFKVLSEYKPNVSAEYLCSSYDTNNSRWSENGCSSPIYNSQFDRYECNCSHLSTFALLWLPKILQPNYLTPQDIASLIFLSLSILCFIAVIVHSLAIRLLNPLASLRPRDLLPLLSSASTTLLFIFYIALGMTVYTRTTSESGTKCFLSSSVLMFFVYFFLIFMFCAKTSVGYFNYLRFVYLFPEPSNRKLVVSLIISFFLAITWTSFAAGLNSNPSYNITQLHGNKICWFTRDVLYYFLTIPVCIFLLLNLLTIIFVAKHIINHVRRATSPHQSYERMKRCVLVLLSSCVTQGIGWLFGPFISFIDPTAGDIVGWFFVIFNGLEGVWSILLYMIIRFQHMDEQLRVTAYKQVTETTGLSSLRKSEKERASTLSSILTRRSRNTHKNTRKERSASNNRRDVVYIDWQVSSTSV
jgi:hypothetical protein